MADTVKLFVYGTLRRPAGGPAADTHYHQQVAESVLSVEPAHLDHASLHDFGPYPGVAKGDGSVVGEVFELLVDALDEADRIEGHPNFYARRLETVRLASGAPVEAWVYWAPTTQTSEAPRIESGDWFDRPSVASGPLQVPDDPELRAAISRLAAEPCSWLSTVRADIRPHAVPMWHVVHGNRIYLVTPNSSQKLANIRSNPNVVLAIPDPLDVVIVDGWAMETPASLDVVRGLFVSKYEWDPANERAGTHEVIEITPHRVRRWNGQNDVTSWEL